MHHKKDGCVSIMMLGQVIPDGNGFSILSEFKTPGAEGGSVASMLEQSMAPSAVSKWNILGMAL